MYIYKYIINILVQALEALHKSWDQLERDASTTKRGGGAWGRLSNVSNISAGVTYAYI